MPAAASAVLLPEVPALLSDLPEGFVDRSVRLALSGRMLHVKGSPCPGAGRAHEVRLSFAELRCGVPGVSLCPSCPALLSPSTGFAAPALRGLLTRTLVSLEGAPLPDLDQGAVAGWVELLRSAPTLLLGSSAALLPDVPDLLLRARTQVERVSSFWDGPQSAPSFRSWSEGLDPALAGSPDVLCVLPDVGSGPWPRPGVSPLVEAVVRSCSTAVRDDGLSLLAVPPAVLPLLDAEVLVAGERSSLDSPAVLDTALRLLDLASDEDPDGPGTAPWALEAARRV